MTDTARISPHELADLLRSHGDVRVLDVRTPGEHEAAHIPGAYNIPLRDLDDVLDELSEVSSRVVVVCEAGGRAHRACGVLDQAGVERLELLDGGMQAWVRDGQPVHVGRRRWDLERQVRLVAGGLVLASVVASIAKPAARFAAGFVGAGLVTAALTNSCAMGNVLSRLPYNRPTSRHAADDVRATAQLLMSAPVPAASDDSTPCCAA